MRKEKHINNEVLKRISSEDIDKTVRLLSCYNEFYKHKGDLHIITHSNPFKDKISETTAR